MSKICRIIKPWFEAIVGCATIISCIIAVITLNKVQAIYNNNVEINEDITVLAQLNTLLLKETIHKETVYKEKRDSIYFIQHDTIFISMPRAQVPLETVSPKEEQDIINDEDRYRQEKGLNNNWSRIWE